MTIKQINRLYSTNFPRLYPLYPLPRTWYISIESHPITRESGYFLSFIPENSLHKIKKDSKFGLSLCFFSWIKKELLDSYKDKDIQLLPSHFVEWKPFIDYFHKDFMPRCLSLKESCEEWNAKSKSLPPHTWMNLHDERTFTNTTPYPEDIFGVVKLDSNCNLLASTYQELFTHRLITLNGRFKLPKSTQDALENDLHI